MKINLIFTLISFVLPLLVSSTQEKVYIVYFGTSNGEKTHEEIKEFHRSYLFSLKNSEEEAKSSLLHSYTHNINGFAATLTADEAKRLSEMDEVVSIFPSKIINLHTTRSWEFLDVRHAEKRNVTVKNELLSRARSGENIIVGLLDTGIWPESESFQDQGIKSIPKSWKGICQEGEAFNSSHCNKKIIGARYYFQGFEKSIGPLDRNLSYRSARDDNGHGTHTSSTVGGRIVHAKLNGGFAHGTASGGAPLVHLAIYKVCWPYFDKHDLVLKQACDSADIMAAFHDAIRDGVDVLSLSIGNPIADYASDAIALASLHAAQNNIIVACSGGNEGPGAYTVTNQAPWVITVAASSIDRAFPAPLLLGNGTKIMGESVSSHKLQEQMYPLVFAGDIATHTSYPGFCTIFSLPYEKVKGKIVLCYAGHVLPELIGIEVKRAGGVGVILGNKPRLGEMVSMKDNHLPAMSLGATKTQQILSYINTTKNPMAYINFGRTMLDVKPAPYMADFSSRGPNLASRDLLKPDVTAPGLNILAAWSESPKVGSPEKYKMISGTSMSAPHVAAVAALLKAIHPTWSTAAIRSAIMTTAISTNNMKMPIADLLGVKADPYQYGSGHIHPSNAADPGLIYDASFEDYLLFLCSNNGEPLTKSFKCPPNPPSPNNLNYPSLAIWNLTSTVTIKRTVTNVGGSGVTYFSQVEAPEGISMKVSPSRLSFKKVGEKRSFMITVETEKKKGNDASEFKDVFGSYSWSDGVHVVRSPVAVNLGLM